MPYETLIGNATLKARLAAVTASGHVPHAILLEGPDGCGKRTLARLIAAATICQSAGDKPCGVCPACLKAAAQSHPDVLEFGGDSRARSFHIDEIRTLREQAYLKPNEAERRVFLLFCAQSMTVAAQNALLRILEEPPAHVSFVLTCESRSQLLETIQSRALCLSMTGVEFAEALPFLQEKFPDAKPDELQAVLTAYDGCLGPAVACLEGGDFAAVQALIEDVAEAIVAPDEIHLLRLTGKFEKDTALTDAVLAGLKPLFRDALHIRKGAASKRLSQAAAGAKRLARTLPEKNLVQLLQAADALTDARHHNMNQTLLITLFCARLRAAAGK